MALLGHIAAGPVGEVKAIPTGSATQPMSSVMSGGWYRILESWPGAWQHNVEVTLPNVTTHPAVFACATLIAGDISKMRLRLMQQDDRLIWSEVSNPAFSPVLRDPNGYQDPIQFVQSWLYSKLFFGNTYVLKVRDNRQIVTQLHVLDPARVTPLVAPNGDVFYQLKRDDLSQLPQEEYVVPASEIIHDRWNCFFHPLVGLSPIYAAGVAAVQGLNIQTNSTNFFGNGSLPGGVLTAPGFIHQETADRLKAYFDTNFSGDNAGKVAVMGDGLHYERMAMSATDSQLIEQLKWSNATVASVFHVPEYMVGGAYPSYNNVQALNTQYYTQCLQVLVRALQTCLKRGLGLAEGAILALRYSVHFDLDDLLLMDSATKMATLEAGKNYLTPNEGRLDLNKPPVTGGDTVFRQQQDYSLEALNKRDSQADPFASKVPAPAPTAPVPADDASEMDKSMDDAIGLLFSKAYAEGLYEPAAVA